MSADITYSIAVPVYNSERSLTELCTRITDTMAAFSFEIILVDDASTDKSWNVIMQLKETYPGIIKPIQLSKNYGQHAATLCAFSFCKGAYVITIDDDMQYNPDDILLLIAKSNECDADIVYGLSNTKIQSRLRHLGSKFIRLLSDMYEDGERRGSSFRLLTSKVAAAIAENHTNTFVSIDIIARWYTSSVAFVDVVHRVRSSGKSGYSIVQLIKLYLSTVTTYSIIPLKIITYIGFAFSVILFLVGVNFVIRKIFGDVPTGYTSIIVTILFCSSMIMFCLGLIGQYLFISFMANQNKPSYSIKNVIK